MPYVPFLTFLYKFFYFIVMPFNIYVWSLVYFLVNVPVFIIFNTMSYYVYNYHQPTFFTTNGHNFIFMMKKYLAAIHI